MIVCRCHVETEFVKLISLDGVLYFNPRSLVSPLGYPSRRNGRLLSDVCTYLSLKDGLEEVYNQPNQVFIQFFSLITSYIFSYTLLCSLLNVHIHISTNFGHSFFSPLDAFTYFGRTGQRICDIYLQNVGRLS